MITTEKREIQRQKCREYYWAHREKILANVKRREAEKEKADRTYKKRRLDYLRQWRTEHWDQQQAANRQWARKNVAKVREMKMRRKAVTRGVPIEQRASIRAFIEKIKRKRVIRCYYCGRKTKYSDVHFDHVFPICKGGGHTVGNLCVSCKDCNLRKNGLVLGVWEKEGQLVLSL